VPYAFRLLTSRFCCLSSPLVDCLDVRRRLSPLTCRRSLVLSYTSRRLSSPLSLSVRLLVTAVGCLSPAVVCPLCICDLPSRPTSFTPSCQLLRLTSPSLTSPPFPRVFFAPSHTSRSSLDDLEPYTTPLVSKIRPSSTPLPLQSYSQHGRGVSLNGLVLRIYPSLLVVLPYTAC
jgi:hypothetical protein